MSDMERNKGKLIPTGKTLEQLAEELVTGEIPSYCETKADHLENEMEEFGLAKIDGQIFKVEFEVRGDDDMFMADVEKNDDGSVDFHTIHYNGGGHWTEVIEGELKRKK